MAKSANTLAREEFGKRLGTLRRQAGITVAVASRAAGISSGTWTKYEMGQHRPGIDKAPNLARALNIPIAALYESPDGSKVIAEVRVSAATLADVKQRGTSAAEATADRIAKQLVPRLIQAASPPRPPRRIARQVRTSEPFRLTAESRRQSRLAKAIASLAAAG